MSWIYPCALGGLFVAEIVAGVPVANINHLVGIGTGWLLADGLRSSAETGRRLAAVLPLSAALLLASYRPWDPVWHAVHGTPPAGPVLAVERCDVTPDPPPPTLASASPLRVVLVNPRGRRITVEYLSAGGSLVTAARTRAAARSLRPLGGSVWRVSAADGTCVAWFTAVSDGIVTIP